MSALQYQGGEGVTHVDYKDDVHATTDAAMTASTRVGNTRTGDANGALAAVDGVTPVVGRRYADKDNATGADRGIWVLRVLGTGSTKHILDRAEDFATDLDVTPGAEWRTEDGTANKGKRFYVSNTGTVTLNTTAITIVEQVSSPDFGSQVITTSGGLTVTSAGFISIGSAPADAGDFRGDNVYSQLARDGADGFNFGVLGFATTVLTLGGTHSSATAPATIRVEATAGIELKIGATGFIVLGGTTVTVNRDLLLVDRASATKKVDHDLTIISASTTRVVTYPDRDLTFGVTNLKNWNASEGISPVTGGPAAATRNEHPTLDYDAASDESAYFHAVMPEDYGGGGLTVTLHWVATSATSGDVVWDVLFEATVVQDIDSDGFASAQSATVTTNGTSGIMTVTAIAFTNAEADSIAAGGGLRIRVTRDADNGDDDMTGDAQLLSVSLTQ